MDPNTVHRLLTLNRQFYQTLGLSFSSTRQRLQPGVRRILERRPFPERWIDLGCGNGELWRFLEQAGFSGVYVGLDFSLQMLQSRKLQVVERQPTDGPEDKQLSTNDPPEDSHAKFLQVDLSSDGWQAEIPGPPFDVAVAFAVLHHLPGQSLRLEVLHKIHRLLLSGGRFFHSEWQFLNSERLRSRIQPWEKGGLSPEEVDPGDYLLDWRHGEYGLRYVHHFDETELSSLAEQSGFRIIDTFLSDGENSRLGLYQEWVKQGPIVL